MTHPHESGLIALRAQAATYERLLKLGERQRVAVESADEPTLLAILTERQTVLAEAAATAEVTRPLREAWPDVSLDAGDFAEAEGLWKQVKAALDEVTRRDRDDALMLQRRKLSIGQELRRTTSARVANGRYLKAAGQGGRLDAKS